MRATSAPSRATASTTKDYGSRRVCAGCCVLGWGEDEGVCAAGGKHDWRGSPSYEVWHEDEEDDDDE